MDCVYEKADRIFNKLEKQTEGFSHYNKNGCLAMGWHFAAAIKLKVEQYPQDTNLLLCAIESRMYFDVF